MPQGTRLTRTEWGLLRAALGKPRRFSLTFLRQVRLMCPSKETMLAPDAAQRIALRVQCRRLLNPYPASKQLRHQHVVCRFVLLFVVWKRHAAWGGE